MKVYCAYRLNDFMLERNPKWTYDKINTNDFKYTFNPE